MKIKLGKRGFIDLEKVVGYVSKDIQFELSIVIKDSTNFSIDIPTDLLDSLIYELYTITEDNNEFLDLLTILINKDKRKEN